MKVLKSENLGEKGFIYVASRDRMYYELALISCQSLKDFCPEMNVTLFTHEKFLDNRSDIFDGIITEIPIHYRAKMWCMARTPYQKTVYNDCDSIIRHKDVRKIFDFMEDCDMFFGSQLLHTVSNYKWAYIDKNRTIQPKLHGSMCGYHKTDLNIDFMQTWFDTYVEQITTPWKYDKHHYPEWKLFDMFTLWRMTSGKFKEFDRFKELNITVLPRRFNNSGQDLPTDYEGTPVITQIDKGTWETMSNIWPTIKKGSKDPAHMVVQQKINDPIIKYN